ncbi:MAG: Hsp20/alpha crystallin family protein [Desulfobacteraceae bacterium]|nr:Hsp20/alpha crystallin family protein [Desulfobacteraceae bacterium]
MRGSSHLKSVRSYGEHGEHGDVPVTTSERSQESRGSWLESTRLPALLDDMERMMSEFVRRPFESFGTTPFRGLLGDLGTIGMSPAVDVFEEGGSIVVKAELPGLTRKDIEVKLIDNTLEISGEKSTEEKIDRRDYLKVERSYGKFSRTLRLPEGLDGEHVKASFSDGVLEIRIPRIEGKRVVHNIQIK